MYAVGSENKQSCSKVHFSGPVLTWTHFRKCGHQLTKHHSTVSGYNRTSVCPAVALPGSLGQLSLPSFRGKSSTGLLAGIKAGRVHLCRVAGNTV